MCRHRFVSVRCPTALSRLLERRDMRESISAIGYQLLFRASRVHDRTNHAIQFTCIDANAVRGELLAPIECRHPETEIGKPFPDAERTISASSSVLRGLRSSRMRVRLGCEWTSLTQIPFSPFAKTCGASAKRPRAYEFTAGQHRRRLTAPVKFQPDKLARLLRCLPRGLPIQFSPDHCDRKIE